MSKAKYQEKFLVLNTKHLNALLSSGYEGAEEVVSNLHNALERVANACEEAGVDFNRGSRYYVCNQDEPYASVVLDVILSGEFKKVVG